MTLTVVGFILGHSGSYLLMLQETPRLRCPSIWYLPSSAVSTLNLNLDHFQPVQLSNFYLWKIGNQFEFYPVSITLTQKGPNCYSQLNKSAHWINNFSKKVKLTLRHVSTRSQNTIPLKLLCSCFIIVLYFQDFQNHGWRDQKKQKNLFFCCQLGILNI